MKTMNAIVTVLIMLSFALVFQYSDYDIATLNKKEIAELKNSKHAESLGMDASAMLMIPDLKMEVVAGSEYIKAVAGAAIGWVVKSICEFLFALLKRGWVGLKGSLNES
jgi:hypothetical protein